MILNQTRLNTAEAVAREIEDYWDATEEVSSDEKGRAGLRAPVGKVPAKGGKPNGCHTTLERVVARRATETCTKDLESNQSVGNRDILVDAAIGVGELATKKRSVGLNKSTQRAIHHKTRCKETVVNGQTQRRKGKVTASPQAKVRIKARARENIKEKGTTTRTRLDLRTKNAGQRKLNNFGIKRQRVQFVGDVHQHDGGFETGREDRAACVFWVHSCNNAMSECLDVPSPSGISCVQESEEPAGTDRATREMLFAVGCRDDRPFVDSGSVVSTSPVDHATSVPTYESGKCEGRITTTLWHRAQCSFRPQKR